MPDVFIPRDTSEYSPSFNRLVNNNLIYRFALQYTDKHRKELKTYKDWRELEKHLVSAKVVEEMVQYGKMNKVEVTARDMQKSRALMQQHLHGYIIRNVMTEDDFYAFLNKYDKCVIRAMKEVR